MKDLLDYLRLCGATDDALDFVEALGATPAEALERVSRLMVDAPFGAGRSALGAAYDVLRCSAYTAPEVVAVCARTLNVAVAQLRKHGAAGAAEG